MEFLLSLGSNLGDRLENLRVTRRILAQLSGSSVTASAGIYETDPVDVPDEHSNTKFLNTVLAFETGLSPQVLSDSLHSIETSAGRVRTSNRNEPRIIDIDIICAGNIVIPSGKLIIPHPRWHERRFVVQPMADLRPDLVAPGRALPVKELLLTLPETPKVLLFSREW